MKAPPMLKGTCRFLSNICRHWDNIYFRDVPFIPARQCQNTFCTCYDSMATEQKSEATRPTCSPDLPAWKCAAHYKAQMVTMGTVDCWATEVIYNALCKSLCYFSCLCFVSGYFLSILQRLQQSWLLLFPASISKLLELCVLQVLLQISR